MADEKATTQASDTAAEPGPVKYDRFKEVNDEKNALKAALEQERKASAAERARLSDLQKLVETRLPEPKTPEPEWEEPSEKAAREALEETRLVRRELQEFKMQRSRQDARKEIASATATFEFEDSEDVADRLAMEYLLAERQGTVDSFDIAARAKALAEKEKARTTTRSEKNAAKKKKEAEETSSAMAGGVGGIAAPTPKWPERPNRRDPAYAQWERDMADMIRRQHGLG